jgi:two-component system nitrate/nitrite response regulator NarL
MTEAPLRVLVADDEDDVRLLLRLQLEARGHTVTEAADGDEALEQCRLSPPDGIVLDLLMPRRNGFEVIPVLRSEYPDIAIVAYTAVAGDFVRNEMRRLGVPLVLKTADITPLLEILHAAVDGKIGR